MKTIFLVLLALPGFAFAASPAAVNLGSAGDFVILAKTGISTTGLTTVVGDLGVSPAAATYITGFALQLPAASPFSTSALVSGKVYAPGYADPTPANLTTAVLNLQAAYTDAMSRAADVTELGAGNIGSLTLTPGVYKWGTNLMIPTSVTLAGGADDVWIFQVAQNLTVSSGVRIILSGGARARNVFWAVGGQTTIGTNAAFNGTILDQTSIILNTGAQLNGRALAQAAVTLDANLVTQPGSATVSPVSTPASTPVSTPAPTPSPVSTPTPNPISYPNLIISSPTNLPANFLTPTPTLSDTKFFALLQLLQSQRSTQAPIRGLRFDLEEGSRGTSVATLQQFLLTQNKGEAAAALAQVGATAYFGGLTRAALAEFQASVGISPALGNFGPITRAYLMNHY